ASPASLAPSRRLKRRRLQERILGVTATLAALLAIAVLVLVVAAIALKGAKAINVDFFTKVPAVFGQSGGGIAPAIVRSAVLLGWASLMAVPMGVLVAIYVSELAPPRAARVVRMTGGMLTAVPA